MKLTAGAAIKEVRKIGGDLADKGRMRTSELRSLNRTPQHGTCSKRLRNS
jgi:hypothetical protein